MAAGPTLTFPGEKNNEQTWVVQLTGTGHTSQNVYQQNKGNVVWGRRMEGSSQKSKPKSEAPVLHIVEHIGNCRTKFSLSRNRHTVP